MTGLGSVINEHSLFTKLQVNSAKQDFSLSQGTGDPQGKFQKRQQYQEIKKQETICIDGLFSSALLPPTLLILDPGPPLPGDEGRHLLGRLRLAAQDPRQASTVQLRDVLDFAQQILGGEGCGGQFVEFGVYDGTRLSFGVMKYYQTLEHHGVLFAPFESVHVLGRLEFAVLCFLRALKFLVVPGGGSDGFEAPFDGLDTVGRHLGGWVLG